MFFKKFFRFIGEKMKFFKNSSSSLSRSNDVLNSLSHTRMPQACPRDEKLPKTRRDDAKNATVRRSCARSHENKELKEGLRPDKQRLYFRK